MGGACPIVRVRLFEMRGRERHGPGGSLACGGRHLPVRESHRDVMRRARMRTVRAAPAAEPVAVDGGEHNQRGDKDERRRAHRDHRPAACRQGLTGGRAVGVPAGRRERARLRAQPQAVRHDAHRTERHRGAGEDRVQQAERGHGDGNDVVAERPHQVLPDRPQRLTRECDGLCNLRDIAVEEGDVTRFHGDVSSRCSSRHRCRRAPAPGCR